MYMFGLNTPFLIYYPTEQIDSDCNLNEYALRLYKIIAYKEELIVFSAVRMKLRYCVAGSA